MSIDEKGPNTENDSKRESGLMGRTLGNLSRVWSDIAQGASRSLGLSASRAKGGDPDSLAAVMKECLEARGGEVSARLRAAELGEIYLTLDAEGRGRFLTVLAQSFATDDAQVKAAIETYQSAEPGDALLKAEGALKKSLEPPRVKLLTQFNALPQGVKFLVDLRNDLLVMRSKDPYLKALDRDILALLTAWFDVGFLDLQEISWDSPASLLEKLIAYEAVHEIRSWADLRNRLEADRRLYALFHPRMPDEPLAFVEVALVKGISRDVGALLDETVPAYNTADADSAIFYSISNTQAGLRGVSFGEYLIKRVVTRLSKELPHIKTYATLSPIPGFRRWLDGQSSEILKSVLREEEAGGVRALGGSDDLADALSSILNEEDWLSDPVRAKALETPLSRLAVLYLSSKSEAGLPLDPVARFHLKNGARLEQLNWAADKSARGLKQSAGMMVNYRYLLADIEKNHEAYMRENKLAMSSEFRALSRQVTDSGGSPLKKLGFG